MIRDILDKNEVVSINAKEIEVLKEYFPSCFTADGTFDIERFKSFLIDKVNITQEGYELKFLGKNYAKMLTALDSETVIVPDDLHNSKPENANSQNIYITGDNLDGIKHLLKSYERKIKCIYIDPPYNTGKGDFIYKDRFSFTAEELAEKLSVDEDQALKVLDLCKRGSASHSAWLMFMYPRLKLARDLLDKERGVIFVSVDNNEHFNCKLMMDDIFGEENFVGDLIIQTATDNNPTQINTEHEYMLCYARNKSSLEPWYRKSEAAESIKEQYEELKKKYSDVASIQAELRKWIKANIANLQSVDHYNNVDEKGVYSSSSNSSNPHPGGYDYDILHPITHKAVPKPDNGWRWPEDTFWNYDKEGEVCWGIDHTTQPHVKKRIETAREQLKSLIYEDNRAETKLLTDILGEKDIFENPKSHSVLRRIIEFVTDDNDIVLDFFSGSATIGHAVMEANILNDTHRSFILVQLPENLDDLYSAANANDKKKIKKVIEYMDKHSYPHTLDYVGYQRLINTRDYLMKLYPDCNVDLGFRHYCIKTTPDNTLDKLLSFDKNCFVSDNTIKDLYGNNAILSTWLLHDGYAFETTVKKIDIAGYSAYWCKNHLYLLDSGISEEAIASLVDLYNKDASFNPRNIVVFGYSFSFVELENLKTNVKILQDSEKRTKVNLDIRY